MPVSDELSVCWVNYCKWARASAIHNVWPTTVEAIRRSAVRLASRKRMDPKVSKLIQKALYEGDPMQGPPVPGRLSKELHEARCMELTEAYRAGR